MPGPVFLEVRDLSLEHAKSLRLTIVEPSDRQLAEALEKKGRLSFQDLLCLLLARDRGVPCMTNDKALRRACSMNGVEPVWGLEILVLLAGEGSHSREDLLTVGRQVCSRSLFLGDELFRKLQRRLSDLR